MKSAGKKCEMQRKKQNICAKNLKKKENKYSHLYMEKCSLHSEKVLNVKIVAKKRLNKKLFQLELKAEFYRSPI